MGKKILICSLLFIVPLANTKYKYLKCRQRYKSKCLGQLSSICYTTSREFSFAKYESLQIYR